MNNHARAVLGRRAVHAGVHDQEDARTNVIDTLTNIMHYCDTRGVDFNSARVMAEIHYSAELEEE